MSPSCAASSRQTRRRRGIFSRFASPAIDWNARGSVLQQLLLVSVLVSSPPSGRDVIKAMHDRYAGKWYRALSFVQQNTATRPDGSQQHSVWREYAALPGKLRIEFVPPDSGHGILFVNDS